MSGSGIALGALFAALAAAVYAGLGLWMVLTRERRRGWPSGIAALMTVGVLITATWAGALTMVGPSHPLAEAVHLARDAAWIAFVALVGARSAKGPSPDERGRVDRARTKIGRHWLAIVLIAIAIGALAASVHDASLARFVVGDAAGAATPLMDRAPWQMIVTIGGVLLIDRTVRAMASDARRPMLAVLGGLAALWVYDFNVHLLSYLAERPATTLLLFQPLFAMLIAAPIAVDAFDRPSFRIRPSRAMTYRLLAIGLGSAYLLVLAVMGFVVRLVGGDYGDLVQPLFLMLALFGAIMLVVSGRVRSWLQVMLAKHFYEHRYDYRVEWLRFADAIGDARGGNLAMRIARAMATLVDSPAALLLLPDGHGRLALAAAHRWTLDQPAVARLSAAQAERLVDGRRILIVAELRAGTEAAQDRLAAPDWLSDLDEAWALVPLVHDDRLEGAVVLARPLADRPVDWEDLDVLRVVGRQSASYLAEQAGQAALADARQFDDFNRRFAFILHDIKNLASQMTLLAANAERHGDKPAFRADMLGTLRGASERLSALIARLSRQDLNRPLIVRPVRVAGLVRAAIATRAGEHPVVFEPLRDVEAMGDPAAIEQIIGHLLQNAVEASPPGAPVEVVLSDDEDGVAIRVTDTGPGMDADFVRSRLFRPFQSTKSNGFGIGLFEARGLAHAMGATIEVDTLVGVGTRFTLTLQRAAVVPLQDSVPVDRDRIDQCPAADQKVNG